MQDLFLVFLFPNTTLSCAEEKKMTQIKSLSIRKHNP